MNYFRPGGRGPRRIAAAKLRVPLVIENRYVLALRRILRQVHAEYLKSVHYHQDAADPKLTLAQIQHLKSIKETGSAPWGGRGAAIHGALTKKGLVEGPGWGITPLGHAALEQLASEPVDIAGVRIVRAIKTPVGKAFDQMAAGVQRANSHALASIGANDLRMGPQIEAFRDKNIQLIENAGRVYAQQVREVLEDPENRGKRVEDLADLIKERESVSESRAELIARDQTLKLNADINKTRQENAGVTQYTWSTSHDERVRDSHKELDGQVFSWNNPPEPGHPGEDFQCRCIALPVFEGLDQ